MKKNKRDNLHQNYKFYNQNQSIFSKQVTHQLMQSQSIELGILLCNYLIKYLQINLKDYMRCIKLMCIHYNLRIINYIPDILYYCQNNYHYHNLLSKHFLGDMQCYRILNNFKNHITSTYSVTQDITHKLSLQLHNNSLDNLIHINYLLNLKNNLTYSYCKYFHHMSYNIKTMFHIFNKYQSC